MSKRVRYTIPYQGLSNGKHCFEFDVTDRLFSEIEESEIKKGNARVIVNLEKSSSLLKLEVSIEGQVEVTCDRCLEEFYMPISFNGVLYVKFSETVTGYVIESEGNFDEELLWQNPNDPEIDLTQYIYESICLSLPYQRVHPEDENGNSLCNPDMLKRFSVRQEENMEQD